MSSNATSTSKDSPNTALMYINLLVPPMLVIFGVTFNSFTILTMRTRYFRKVSTSVYLKVGAINDALALMISLIAHWLYVNFPSVYVRTDMSHIMCKFFNFYGAGNNDFGIIVTVSMTAERALVIASPLGAAKKCSVARAWKVVSILLVLVIVKNIHFLIASDIVPAGRTDRLCDVFVEKHGFVYKEYYTDFHPWMHLFYVVSCAITIIISNSIILHNVRKSFGIKHSRKHQAWRHFVPMLLGESLLLVIFTFPFTFHLALLSIRIKYTPDLYSDEETAVMENLVFSITFYMLYSNKCVNFFMYCITGKQFRDGLVLVLFKCACQDDNRKYTGRSTNFRSTTSSMSVSRSRCSASKHVKMPPSKKLADKYKKRLKTLSPSERLKLYLLKKKSATLMTSRESLNATPSNALNDAVNDRMSNVLKQETGNSIKASNSNVKHTPWSEVTTTSNKLCTYTSSNDKLSTPNVRDINPAVSSREATKSTVSSVMTKSSSDKQTSVPSPRKRWFNSETVSEKSSITNQRKCSPGNRLSRFNFFKENWNDSGTIDTVCLYVEINSRSRELEMLEKTQDSISVYL